MIPAVRILSSDILIADIIIPLAGNQQMAALVQSFELKPGGKAVLDDGQLQIFSSAVAEHDFTVVPGGSSANMLVTLSRIMGGEVSIRFFGIIGEGPEHDIIKSSLDDAHITLLPDQSHYHHHMAKSAISFVFVDSAGQCTIATHPGNAREILRPAMLAEHTIDHVDIVLAQGSLWHKLQHDFADRIYKLAIKHNKQLWLTLPTQAKLEDVEREKFFSMLPAANVVFGNEGELTRLYDCTFELALQRLQLEFKKHATRSSREPIGFITLGKRGAVLVSEQNIKNIKPGKLKFKTIANTLGAGDTSYAGFAAGYLKKLPDEKSAKIAMTLAAEKLQCNGPRLANPLEIIHKNFPDLKQLF